MGMDIAFNRSKAIAAGLQVTALVRGTAIEIENCKRNGHDDDYCEWLSESVEVIHVPGQQFTVENGGYGDDIVIRANKWGLIYDPMTQWLKAHNISWSEF